ncbi:MAG: DEAD/DEAH box helicase family protein [Candidatus Cloacimonetes bacterium]|nr:DEAD/DEAH box helicase family protein [Candidatus Cloacimonadota bacterium]
MAYKQFGNTWWGDAWLNALHYIDYSNRLPRGQRYARNGSVVSIEFKKKAIEARVSGRRSTPYKVKIKKKSFTESQKQTIKEIVINNPFYISQLASHKLPQQLLASLEKENINLFPKSWSDMEASCSCPDWAVPCKHIAAVFYIIANEIDQNPFLVFDFHNYNLLTEVAKSIEFSNSDVSTSNTDMLHLDKTLSKSKKSKSKIEKNVFSELSKINLSIISETEQDIFKILSDNPLFITEKNYHKELQNMYKFCIKKITKSLNRKTIMPDVYFLDYTIKRIIISTDNSDFKCLLQNKKEEKDRISLINIDDILVYFSQIDFDDLDEADDKTLIFWFCISFTFHLIKSGAYLPQILEISEKEFFMRWIPALFKKEVSEVFDKISEFVPMDFIEINYNQKSFSPSPQEELLFFISKLIKSFILQYYSTISSPCKIDKLFYNSFSFSIKQFEDQQIPQTIYLWLNKFNIVQQEITPVIKIDETPDGDKFNFEIMMEGKDPNSDLIPLKKVLTLKKYQKIRYKVLKDLSHLGDFLPATNEYLAQRANKPISINSDHFVSVWFDSLPILQILNIKSLIPKSLSKIIVPQLTLSMEKKSGYSNIKTFLDLQKILAFNWKISIGDNFIDPQEFFKKVKKLSGIVKFADQYILLDSKEIAKLMKAAQKDIPEFSPTDILRLGVDGKFKGVELAIEAEVRKIFEKIFKVEKQTIPKTLNATLRDYQIRGYQWLYHNCQIGFGSIIADDMGLGKTIQIISLLLKEKEKKKLDYPALIIVPTTLLTNWEKEFIKFAPNMKIGIYHGTKRKIATGKDIVLTSYGIARQDKVKLNKANWHYIILDEAQNIKNPNTKQTKSIKSLKGNVKIAMTGTPVENRLSEYWSIMDFLNKGLLGSSEYFRKEFAIPIEKERNKNKLDLFLKITSPFILRRVKSDRSIIKDLPDKIITNQYCSLSEEQAALYQNIIDNTMKMFEEEAIDSKIERKGLIFKLMIALKQICNHPVNYLKKGDISYHNSGKATLLITLLEKILDSKEKCLIFTQYTEMGRILHSIISDYFKTEPLFLHGGLSRKKRDKMVEDFQNDLSSKIFILSLKAGGTGLNLTKANHVIHYDLWWNPAVENQATDRAYRIGQHKNVNVHRFITTGTFEEKINQMLDSKKELFDLSVKQGEKFISEMSNKDLKDLISLKK